MPTDAKPETIEGGCLCEGVRYKITFPPDHDFAKAAASCQCEQCRKNAGGLIWHEHTVPTSSVTYTAQDTLRRYHATPGIARGFCGACGSFLFWHKEAKDSISMSVGCFDKDVLARYGELLARSNNNIWCAAAIPGVTDRLDGKMWAYDNEGPDAKLLSSS